MEIIAKKLSPVIKARLLHFLELSIRPIKVANSFGWDELAT